ncbi:MAG TPA: hypothetical protein VHL11_22655 [Phototrophicaceae bacterium]|jgi:hypothetical protein|nr:hypothetical protein [Phototrophicaceae bacterium]
MQTELKVQEMQDGRADFDFFIGKWKGYNRRLRERLKGSTEWEEFEGISVVQKILNGLGNIDEVVFDRAGGKKYGETLRLFDVKTQIWRIYWADGSSGILDIPMVGSFKDGRGEFYCHEMFEGKPVFTRFLWTHSDEDHCRWEQAFSTDAGVSWETNWTADFTRIE